MTLLPAGALLAATLLLAALPDRALAQADLYPGAVPALPPTPGAGPVPDLNPVAGQLPAPRRGQSCAAGPVARPLPGVDPRGTSGLVPNPLRGQRWFVDPREPAWSSYVSYARHRQRRRAALMWRLAREPRFKWFGRWTGPDTRAKVRSYIACAGALQPGAVPLMVVMRHQGRGCSPTYTAGGAAEDARTREWYDRFAEGVGGARVIIGFEPDSLGTIDCLARSRRRARLNVLRYGVDRLSQLPNATIYLEGGASDWEPARRTAKQLRYIGISKVRGFMLNVTHHDWTRANILHGLQISRMVGGKPFIVNTSYNGRGPLHRRSGHRRLNIWCNPPRRGLGPRPSTATANPLVDAYMYVNRPGYSAGACNGGPLPVGSWWPKRALMYARNQTSWLGPPRGTVSGYYRR